jgi:uncharacterized protein (TIGR03435 family)
MRTMVATLTFLALAACVASTVLGHSQETIAAAQIEPARSFDVASVRLTAPRTPPSQRVTNSRVDLTNISLRALLVRVFQIDQPSQLSAPDWLTEVSVDIHATLPEGSTREHVSEMLKTLLITRFGFRAHVESRPTDVYELVVGKGELKIQEVPVVDDIDKVFPADSSRKLPQVDRTIDTLDGRIRTMTSAGGGQVIITERSMYERIRTGRGTEEIDATRISMTQLATLLSFTVDRPVVDRTMLTGLYRLRIELPPPTFLIPSVFSEAPPTEPSVVSPFSAVEKLGLRLERRRAMLDTLVVDHIDRVPTDN